MTPGAWLYRILFPLAKVYWFVRRPKTRGAGCVIEFDDKILLVRNTYGSGLWSFPGGGFEKNETPEQVATREVLEEVGIVVKDIKPLGTFDFTLHYRTGVVYTFLGKGDNPNINIDRNEILEAGWFSLNELSGIEFSSIGKRMLDLYLNSKK